MEKRTKKQAQKIGAITMADKYMGFCIPLTGYREADIVMPKVFTPAEAEDFKQLILPIIDGTYDYDEVLPEKYEEIDIVVSMFLIPEGESILTWPESLAGRKLSLQNL